MTLPRPNGGFDLGCGALRCPARMYRDTSVPARAPRCTACPAWLQELIVPFSHLLPPPPCLRPGRVPPLSALQIPLISHARSCCGILEKYGRRGWALRHRTLQGPRRRADGPHLLPPEPERHEPSVRGFRHLSSGAGRLRCRRGRFECGASLLEARLESE